MVTRSHSDWASAEKKGNPSASVVGYGLPVCHDLSPKDEDGIVCDPYTEHFSPGSIFPSWCLLGPSIFYLPIGIAATLKVLPLKPQGESGLYARLFR